MNKPFIIQVQELEKNIVEIINKSQLPNYVKKTILQYLCIQLENVDIEIIKHYNEEIAKKSQKKESDK